MKTNLILASLSITFFWACQPKKAVESSEKEEEIVEAVTPSVTQIWASDTTILTPESVVYNSEEKVLYVSCINGVPPTAKDGDGFIAKISASDGSTIDLDWVTGLNAPKGMGLLDGKLYATDIDEIVEIDITTGEITNKYAVTDATFLNDIDISADGGVYASDMKSNKIHLLKDGAISTVVESSDFGGANGLLHLGDKLMLSTSGSGNFFEINTNDWTYKIVTDSIFGGDGVEKSGDDYLVSSWSGELYYVSATGEKTKMIDTKGVSNKADFDFDDASNTIYMPTFFGNQVIAYKLNK
ncbi:MAG: ATP-binding protein [Cyclobacteriaceae bacterium]